MDEWLEFQLGEVVGLEDLKRQIRSFYRGVMLDEARRKKGHNVGSAGGKYHMIFQGNPGTGKTSLARLMARLLYRVGIAPRDALTEVQQEQLVAGFVGQTAPKTQKVIDEAAGGILFIDEAYRLAQGRDQFGKEAIEQLMAAMNEPPGKAPIMIFAGYPADMENFMNQNDGLYRRIPYTFDFPNYSCAEIAEILELMVIKNGFSLESRLLAHGRQRLARIIETKTMPRTRSLMNGGLCERIFAFAKQALDARDDPSHPSVVLSEEDVASACQKIPPPPEPTGRDEDGDALPAQRAGAPGAAGGAVASSELQELREHVRRLQDELNRLQQENAQLRREAAQGSMLQVLETTLKPSGGSPTRSPQQTPPGNALATKLDGTAAMELKGIRGLLTEVRRLKAELQGRDERLGQLEAENRKLQTDKRTLAEAMKAVQEHARGGHFEPGTPVQYLSGTLNKWIDAVVHSFDLATGTYDLDVKKRAHPDRVRRRPLEALEGTGSLPRQASEPPEGAGSLARCPSETLDAQSAGSLGRSPPTSPWRHGLSTQQVQEAAACVAEQFRQYDIIGDGTVDRAELAQVLRQLDPDVWPDERVDKLLTAMDVGSDGRIQYEEFIDWAFQVVVDGACPEVLHPRLHNGTSPGPTAR